MSSPPSISSICRKDVYIHPYHEISDLRQAPTVPKLGYQHIRQPSKIYINLWFLLWATQYQKTFCIRGAPRAVEGRRQGGKTAAAAGRRQVAAEWQQGGGDRSAVVGGRRHESGRAAGERRRQESSRVAAAGERLESGGDRRVELMRTLMSCPAGRPAGCPLGEHLQASCPPSRCSVERPTARLSLRQPP